VLTLLCIYKNKIMYSFSLNNLSRIFQLQYLQIYLILFYFLQFYIIPLNGCTIIYLNISPLYPFSLQIFTILSLNEVNTFLLCSLNHEVFCRITSQK
jgi:hypothetical protein